MKVDPEMGKKLNTIYIISKGRPQCHTAATLTKLKYPGEWYIVCGNNDETVPQYIEKWGEDKTLFSTGTNKSKSLIRWTTLALTT